MQTLIQQYDKTHRRIGRTVCTGYVRFGPNRGHTGVGILTNVAIIDGRVCCFIDGKKSEKSANRIWDLPKSEVVKTGWFRTWDIRLRSTFIVDHYLRCLRIFKIGQKHKWLPPFVMPKIDWRKEGF